MSRLASPLFRRCFVMVLRYPVPVEIWINKMMIEVLHDQLGFLVTHRTDESVVLGAVRFSKKVDADDFAALWSEWLGVPTKAWPEEHFERT